MTTSDRIGRYIALWDESSQDLDDEACRQLLTTALSRLHPAESAQMLSELQLIPTAREFDPALAKHLDKIGLEYDPPDEFTKRHPGLGHYKPPGSRFWIKWKDISDLKLSVLIGLSISLLMSSPPIGLGAAALTTLAKSVKRLSEDELEVFRILLRLTDGNVYTKEVSLEELLEAMPDDLGERHNKELLAKMKRRGILEENAGLWRARI